MPTAGESLAYNAGQIIIVCFIAAMGTDSLAAYVYNLTLIRFILIAGISIGAGAQMLIATFDL